MTFQLDTTGTVHIAAPEAREGEEAAAVDKIAQVIRASGIDRGWAAPGDANELARRIYALGPNTHPAAPSDDKLRIAVEALKGARQIAGRLDSHDAGMMEDEIQAIDQALVALKTCAKEPS